MACHVLGVDEFVSFVLVLSCQWLCLQKTQPSIRKRDDDDDDDDDDE